MEGQTIYERELARGNVSVAAQFLERAGEYYLAFNVWERAGALYEEAGDGANAGECFQNATLCRLAYAGQTYGEGEG